MKFSLFFLLFYCIFLLKTSEGTTYSWHLKSQPNYTSASTLGSSNSGTWDPTTLSISFKAKKTNPSNTLLLGDFGFSKRQGLSYLPSSSTIDGYNATVVCTATKQPKFSSISLYVGSNQNGKFTPNNVILSSASTSYTFGSPTSTWSSTLSANDWLTNNPSVGIVLQPVQNPPPPTATLTSLTFTIYYSIVVGINSISPTFETDNTTTPSGGGIITILLNGPLNQVTASNRDIKCKVGSNLGTITHLSATSRPNYIQCQAPSQNAYGSYLVSITLNNQDYTTDQVYYTYVPNIQCGNCNNGTCNTTTGTCICYPNYSGPSCTTPTCSLYNNCSGNGICVAPNECSCNPGYSGLNCSTITCEYDCNGHGTCQGPNFCYCNTNYYGTYCGTFCSPSTTCFGNGNCTSSGTCQCNPGWTGSNCQTPICSSPCVNGTCVAPDTCSCNANYFGSTCNIFCSSSSTCSGNGNCQNNGTCQCYSGYGGSNCAPICSGNCNNQGTCVNPNNCSCNADYYGSDCSLYCSSSTTCSGNGTCTSSGTCQCNSPYGGVNCNISTCSGCGQGLCQSGGCTCFPNYYGSTCNIFCLASSTCSGNGNCTSSGTCQCNNGWSGTNCTTAVCSGGCASGTCISPDNCKCDTNFYGTACDLYCLASITCSGNGYCTSSGICQCKNGWSGINCSIPVCSTNCSLSNGVCVGPNTCDCNAGWGPGPYPNCSMQTNANCISLNNCSGHGICVQNGFCVCEYGWSNAYCSAPLCNQVGNCTSPSNGFCISPDTCQCNSGYTGTQCQLFDCAANNYCGQELQQGVCVGPNNCSCNPGWSLPDCTTPICDCPGICVSPGKCVCPSGTLPPNCTLPPPPSCLGASNCSGNGICLGSDICVCYNGYSGFNCTPICQIIVCVPGQGICIAPDTCQCFPGFSGLACEVPNQRPIIPGRGTPGGIIAVAVIIPLLVLIGAGLLLWWFYMKKFRYAGRRERPKPIEPKYQELVFGDYLNNILYVTPGLGATKTLLTWQSFEQLLTQQPDFPFVTYLIEKCTSSDQEELAKNLLFCFEYHGLSIPLFDHVIRYEIQTTDTETTLFRANSFATKMFRTYSKMHGLKYLFSVLGLPLLELKQQIEEESVSVEVDPNKLEEGEDEVSNRWQLLLLTQKIFTSLYRSSNEAPPALRHVGHIIKTSIAEKFPNSVNKSLGAFWFLRFFCPAIVAPHAYGLLKEPPKETMQRELILLSKILQNLANEQTFGKKEVGMEKLNEFIDENKNTLGKFLEELSKPAENVVKLEIPSQVRTNSLCYLHTFVANNADLSNVNEPLASEVKQVLEQLGAPPERVSIK